jgi:hypothetical protein
MVAYFGLHDAGMLKFTKKNRSNSIKCAFKTIVSQKKGLPFFAKVSLKFIEKIIIIQSSKRLVINVNHHLAYEELSCSWCPRCTM